MSILQDIKDSFRQPNNTLKQLILINVIVFVSLIVLRTVFFLTGSDWAYTGLMRFIALPSDPLVFMTRPWTIISYFFTHEGFLHIIFNMLNLYWFGQLIREYLGEKKLLSLYILGGIAGGLLYILSYNLIPYFADRAAYAVMIGASASVLAVVVAAATLIPNFTFNLLIIGPVRIKYIAAFLVILSISGAIGDNAGGNIAHLGGALFGWLFVKQLQRGRDMGRPLHSTLDFFTNLFKRRPNLKVTHRQKATVGNESRPSSGYHTGYAGKPSQLEIDLILDKISVSGYESLSKEEKQKLFQASQKD